MSRYIIYSAEDDDAIRDLVTYAAKSEGFNIKAFADAEGLLSECEKQVPDLILLDIMLPGMDGLEALKKFRETYKSADTRIIVLTAKVSEINKVTGLDAGADDYITKPFSVLELMARIRANLRKRMVGIKDGELKVNSLILNQEARTVYSYGKKLNLTQKEFDLLKFLMLNAGVVNDREILLREIWGYEYFGESRTVDIHMKNLREKLGEESENIQSIRGIGYMLARRDT